MAPRIGTISARMVILMALISGTTACKIVSIEEDRLFRSRQSESFDATEYVDSIWQQQVIDYANTTAHPVADLIEAMDSDFSAATQEFGRQSGEGSPWTLIGKGSGVVTSINTDSRIGTMNVELAGGDRGSSIRVLTGPVVLGTTIRDALPSISFNDFANQLAYADVANALTARALDSTQASFEQLAVGDKITFLGAFAVRSAQQPVILTLLDISVDSAENATDLRDL